MKKFFALLLAMLLLASLAACGDQPVTDSSETQPSTPSSNTNTPNSNLDDLAGILLAMTTEGETVIDTVTANSETLLEKLGDSYSTYDANKTAVTEFYNSTSAQATELYASFRTASINYFKCVAAQGLEDYDEWNDAMEEFYEDWDDTMSDYYDAWNDAYEEIYDLCDDVISKASDELDYSVYSDAWSDMYDEYSEAWEAMYDAHSEAWEQTYDDYSDVWDGFYDGKTDVDAILNGTSDKEGSDENDDTPVDPDTDTGSCADIESKVQKDVGDTITVLISEWEELAGVFTDYNSYVSNADKVSTFYEKLNNESANLCVRMYAYALEYAEAVIASGKSTDDLYDDMDELYDVIYDEAGEDIYDGIYDGILEEMYDVLYDGVLEDQPDGVEYSDWSEHRSKEYKQWSDARSDTYEQWSDFRSDVYSFWSDTKSELYKDDFDGAQDEIEDFRKDVEKLQGKEKSDSEESTTEAADTTTDATTEAATDAPLDADTALNGIRPEFKEAMDSYEKFFDEYIAFMKEYKDAGYPISMLNDYSEMMTQYTDAMTALGEIGEGELSTEEALYYSQVMSRISQKLLAAE